MPLDLEVARLETARATNEQQVEQKQDRRGIEHARIS